ncbi:MAG: hypothetical protein HZB65_00655 [Candidatus Aenigmarchaeota archaeon]|nr:hypothetical protein [Candidatus Aenigmarchaeota archaeon]
MPMPTDSNDVIYDMKRVRDILMHARSGDVIEVNDPRYIADFLAHLPQKACEIDAMAKFSQEAGFYLSFIPKPFQ